ncbi:pyruvate carboxylase [Chitinophaga nivalis]|uniref:Pyruvate carboxylase n=1 Tax=Chitinophaga nivalis TaxID=2991709 RepID=A0ABT3IL71_9BACT|nr:pyruvate carboxylase [Chitinophaga nivalis]MCW3465602.1 pyruvate carboxylase [Chitinophaga nivalis]MCW3484707.1 pyruvate carboxylase [Chitinophaga nivalis]
MSDLPLIPLKKIRKLLVANRGEIAVRVLRAAAELRIRTVAVFTYEDRYSLHRYKADEAYQIGKDDDPLKPYLDIEGIIHLAKSQEIDAIHPGYGFLSENVQFARRCGEEGIIFVGPSPEVMAQLGDKVAAKVIAREAGVPLIEDSRLPLTDVATVVAESKRIGFPVMLKAAAGGGGRGMRMVHREEDLERSFLEARNEAGKAFGDDTIFIEKFIEEPKHIEVQLMGDNYGNIIHLYERDCSVQRRFQKVVEIAPSPDLPEATREQLYHYALLLARKVNFNNVGTVEFLVDREHRIYFIEVNPRIQVEHTVTEEVTGIDIVRSQILIAAGHRLADPEIFLKGQEDVHLNGVAIQCRITTEDPQNNFKPDYGTVIAYRNAGGFGIRLDEGSTYSGVNISPFFDSMLVKVTAWGRTLSGACARLHRTLREFRIRGVKTNIGFLENVINHDIFRRGNCTVGFIDKHPELFDLPQIHDRATKTLMYLADVTVNGHPDVKTKDPNRSFRVPVVPAFDRLQPFPEGTKDLLEKMGREEFAQWLRKENTIYFTDTTYRDAHQSLLATRVRTKDMMAVAEGYIRHNPQLFSMEVWGGATFDVAMRFLHECPWRRLQQLRKAMPNVLLQMLFRGSNGVGYSAYPENLLAKFIEKSWENGIDVFRIFDSLNWVEAMAPSIRFVREHTNALAQAAISYTGDVMKPAGNKYTLQYYVDLAKRLEDAGAHMLAVKDMAGLLKPQAAELLIGTLRGAVQLPIVLHTHDTAGVQAATYMKAIEAGVNVVDGSIAALSGLTSQPNLNSLIAVLEGHPRSKEMNLPALNAYSNYWEDVRDYYYPFESDMKAGTAQVYENEIPGGQYSNLRQQAESLGLGDKLELIKRNYTVVNQLFGDIVKVTPSSKVVGDMALFMTSNNLTAADILDEQRNLAFPASVKGFFRGELGVPYGGFPPALQRIVLKGEAPLPAGIAEQLPPVDFDADFAAFQTKYPLAGFLDYLSYHMFPKVFEEYYEHAQVYGNVEAIPTPAFFYGLKLGEEILVTLGQGKTIIVKLQYILPADDSGMRTVVFELNGYARRVQIRDRSVTSSAPVNKKVSDPAIEIGAPLQGRLSRLLIKSGDQVLANAPLFIIEAMKMETTVTATRNGKVKSVPLAEGTMVQQDDVVVEWHE